MHKFWSSGGAELLDKIGPAIFVVHSAGGPFGYLVANARPKLVKGIVAVEGGMPAVGAIKLENLKGIPIAVVTADNSGRNSAANVKILQDAGCAVDDLTLKSKGILGNGHFMMLENNRKQVFEVIQAWIDEKVKA